MKDKNRLNEDMDLDKIIKKMMRAWGFEKKMTELDIVEAWPVLMGKGVAYRTSNITIQNKVLYLTLNSSVMRDELQFGKTVIIQRVNEFAGKTIINDVWFN